MKMRNDNKNTLILFQHTEHGKDIFTRIIHELQPNLKIEESSLTGETIPVEKTNIMLKEKNLTFLQYKHGNKDVLAD